MFARALWRRCPNCGAGPVTERWFYTRPACPRCQLKLDRGEPDYFLGAMVFNMAFSEGLFAAGLVLVLLLTWPRPPWDAVYYGGIVGMILAPIFFYPYSKLCWLAFDLLFRRPRPEDFEITNPERSSSE
jgi:uncharacterized protein (DUF983 family)